ncbi:DUF6144 family protein [Anaeromicrobium sediminis]|uniref:DUF6144 family protein n=1 Tax=Anaeromicrobium sediminis TaxID=1478221 RepID=UPI0026CCC0E6|nr:DUF6144 family protein [Anaeromicrobium sediminis]
MNQIHNEVKKLFENITKHSNSDVARKIAFGMDLPFSPTKNDKNEWVKYISSELEKQFDEQTIKSIRLGCYCTENGKLDESKEFIKNIYDTSVSMVDFVDKMNEYKVGWYIKDGYLFTKYFSCPCPMLESVDVLPTKTWCYCTVGYNKKIFEYVFDCEVDIELLESIKMGNTQCLMKIIPLIPKIISNDNKV